MTSRDRRRKLHFIIWPSRNDFYSVNEYDSSRLWIWIITLSVICVCVTLHNSQWTFMGAHFWHPTGIMFWTRLSNRRGSLTFLPANRRQTPAVVSEHLHINLYMALAALSIHLIGDEFVICHKRPFLFVSPAVLRNFPTKCICEQTNLFCKVIAVAFYRRLLWLLFL